MKKAISQSSIPASDEKVEGMTKDERTWLHVQIPTALHIELHHQARIHRLSLRDYVIMTLDKAHVLANPQHTLT